MLAIHTLSRSLSLFLSLSLSFSLSLFLSLSLSFSLSLSLSLSLTLTSFSPMIPGLVGTDRRVRRSATTTRILPRLWTTTWATTSIGWRCCSTTTALWRPSPPGPTWPSCPTPRAPSCSASAAVATSTSPSFQVDSVRAECLLGSCWRLFRFQ